MSPAHHLHAHTNSASLMLWADEFRPKDFNSLDVHPEVTERLTSLLSPTIGDTPRAVDLPHLLFYGPPGSGKKTRVMCSLYALYGNSCRSVHGEKLTINPPSGAPVTIPVLRSPVHHEINASALGRRDRFAVQELVSSVARIPPLDATAQPFRVIVLHDADRLSSDAQAALRRTMEVYSDKCRLFLIASNPSGVAAPLRSRCYCLRVPAPSTADLTAAVRGVCNAKDLQISDATLDSIVTNADYNLSRALLSLQATWTVACNATNATTSAAQAAVLAGAGGVNVIVPEWELAVAGIVDCISSTTQSPSQIMADARARFYELLSKGIPADMIMGTMRKVITPQLTSVEQGVKVLDAFALYEQRNKAAQHPEMHLEALVASIMAIIKV